MAESAEMGRLAIAAVDRSQCHADRRRSRARGSCVEGRARGRADRKRVVQGKSVSVRVALGGRRTIKKKNTTTTQESDSWHNTKCTVSDNIAHNDKTAH